MQSLTEEPQSSTAPRSDVLGRVLIMVYVILALAATMRAIYQIISKFDEAPLAYSLSLLSGIIYVLATIALIKRRGIWRTIAWVTLVFEFVGVVVVGLLSYLIPELFAHPSVWSHFGAGYIYIPLVLPVLGMIWLRSENSRPAVAQAAETSNSTVVGDRS